MSLKEIFGSFDPNATERVDRQECKPLTVWVPIAYKDRYDRIQKSSKNGLSKTLKRIVMASIDIAEAKAS